MIEIKNLTVAIEDKQILNGLNLTVNDGEVAAIAMVHGAEAPDGAVALLAAATDDVP